MSEFNHPGANERVEPLPNVPALHLHERNGFGLAGQAKKDPTNAVNGMDGEDGFNYPPIPGFVPPPSLLPPGLTLPPLPDLQPPVFPPFIPGEFPANPGPDAPSNDSPPSGTEFPFMYAEGGWWAFTSEVGWFKFTAPFPTSDPGNGQIWLSPT